jgi:hypothetical protein
VKGKGFTSPKRCQGWIGIAAMVVGGIASSAAKQSDENKQNKVKYADSADLSNLNFEQQSWLSQQQHKWNLEDYQRQQNYSEDAIRGFAQYAPANAASADGSWGAPPPRTDVSAETAGLAPTQANGQPLIIDPRTGQPMLANYTPPAAAPVAPAKTAAPMGQYG